MKKILVAIGLLAVGFYSCVNDNDITPNITNEPSEEISLRSVDDAVNITNHLLSVNSSNSRAQITVSRNDVHIISSAHSRNGNEDTLMYVVNHGDNQGFTMVSAPTNVVPIIAYVEEGDFESEETDSNATFQYAFEESKNYVRGASIGPYAIISYDTIDIVRKIDPRVGVKWGQQWPYNIYAPNRVAGCGPVAVAQMMSYFESPTTIEQTYEQGYAPINIWLNWAEFNKHISSADMRSQSTTQIENHYQNCECADNWHGMLGRLVREIGHRCGARYDFLATAVVYDSVYNCLSEIYPNKVFTQGVDFAILYDLLQEDGVAYCRGTDTEASGHAWVADGTLGIGYMVVKNVVIPSQGSYQSTPISTTIEEKYLHFNWGADGNSNGYFLAGVFDMDSLSYNDDDMPEPTSRYNFNTNVKFLHIK